MTEERVFFSPSSRQRKLSDGDSTFLAVFSSPRCRIQEGTQKRGSTSVSQTTRSSGFVNCENLRPPAVGELTINQLKFVMRGTQMVLLYENMCRAGMVCKYPSVKHIPYIPRVPSAPVASPRSLRPPFSQARGVMLFCALFNYTPKPGRVTYCRVAKGDKKATSAFGLESPICSRVVNQRRSDRRYLMFRECISRVQIRATRRSCLIFSFRSWHFGTLGRDPLRLRFLRELFKFCNLSLCTEKPIRLSQPDPC